MQAQIILFGKIDVHHYKLNQLVLGKCYKFVIEINTIMDILVIITLNLFNERLIKSGLFNV